MREPVMSISGGNTGMSIDDDMMIGARQATYMTSREL